MEEVQIISREIIKPAALQEMPLDYPKTFQISLLDMVAPPAYTPMGFFYPMKEAETSDGHFNKEDEIARLKLSLSQTLANFPMLGGKIKGNLIHCSNNEDDNNNVGALFVEAKVKITMAEFLKKPDLDLHAKFFPLPLLPNEPLLLDKIIQVGAQVNFFSCGGIAIGFSFLHKLMDGTTMSAFIKCWAAFNYEGASKELVFGHSYPYSISSLFPAREMPSDENDLVSPQTPFFVPEGKTSTSRRFVFDAVAISNLKAKAKSTSVPNPTTVEVVTCFIWKYAMKASRQRSMDKKEFVAHDQGRSFVNSKCGSTLIHLVNIRKRMQPPLSDQEVGNIYWRCPSYYESSSTTTKLADLESILRQSLSEINHDFLQKAIGDDGFETFLSSVKQLQELYAKSFETFLFSSWRNMGFNKMNFGWGKPIWHSCAKKMYESIVRNQVTLVETSEGEGIEAWILLDDETMKILENDYKFLKFASPNPSITFA